MESQSSQVLRLLKSGKKLTSMDGFMLGIVRITNRIAELRNRGHNIQDKWMVSGRGKRYKAYFIPEFFDKTVLE